eukprot:1699571-Prymnesium_polylepis.1
MGQVVKGMDKALGSMNVEQISKVMDNFEKSFEDMDVRSEMVEQVQRRAWRVIACQGVRACKGVHVQAERMVERVRARARTASTCGGLHVPAAAHRVCCSGGRGR